VENILERRDKMTWCCPYCGYENLQDPLNSRHTPTCKLCKKERIAPEKLREKIDIEISDLQDILKQHRGILERVSDEIEYYNSELVSANATFKDAKEVVIDCKNEIKRLEGAYIFYEVDRNTKFIDDKKQLKIVVE